MALKSGQSRANANRAIRQEALREQLSNQGHVEQVVENVKKLQDLDNDMDQLQVQRIKTANDAHLKLVNKYLPDLKAMELSGALGLTDLSDEALAARIRELEDASES